MNDDYALYRGRCRELSEKACCDDPTLTLVRGHYYCPIWNREEPHWWTTRPDGTIHDPSSKQFPSKGLGVYTPFNGVIPCSNCGKEMKEEEATIEGNHAFCSYTCHGIFVGVL
jgi:hypothetical protein